VRALYDYTSDDYTSLSFRQGDVIQVLNQLETGWWDGVIGNVRGWFPSNYCAVIPSPHNSTAGDNNSHNHHHLQDNGVESALEDDYYDDDRDGDGASDDSQPDEEPSMLPIEGARKSSNEPEEAAFWIPQATADGRLFYYNTLTGYSTMELPLETPSFNESGPRDRTNIYVPEQTRAPPELVARSIDRFEDDYDGSASEADGEFCSLAT
jgi:son of sevenless-like protein